MDIHRDLYELVDARNELDSVTYQVQRRLEQAGDAVPEHDRARAEMLINDARTALDEQAPIDRLRSLTGELHQMAQALSASVQSRAGGVATAIGNATKMARADLTRRIAEDLGLEHVARPARRAGTPKPQDAAA